MNRRTIKKHLVRLWEVRTGDEKQGGGVADLGGTTRDGTERRSGRKGEREGGGREEGGRRDSGRYLGTTLPAEKVTVDVRVTIQWHT